MHQPASFPDESRADALLRLLTRDPLVSTLGVAAGIALGWALVVAAGGPPTAMAHVLYLPILLAGVSFGARGGAAAGLVAGLAAGPLAAWATHGGSAFAIDNANSWALRVAFFIGIGAVMGWTFRLARNRTNRLLTHLYTDPATALPNLTAAQRYLSRQLMRGRLTGDDRDVVVTLLSVDNHPQLVSTFGHGGADRVMAKLAEELRRTLPHGTYVGRTGPDRFLLIERSPRGQIAINHTQRLQHLQRLTLSVEGIPTFVEISAGVTQRGVATAEPDVMLSEAELAATRTRESGGMVASYDPAEDEQRRQGVRLLGELDRAMAERQLVLHYQPKLDLRDERFTGVEALVRWEHPQRGQVPPGQFIPQVEQTRMIDALTRYVLERAVEQIIAWRQSGYTLKVAVNISPRNLTSDALLNHLRRLLETNQVPTSSIELELTEGALMHVSEARLSLLRALRDDGVTVAVDDFGTGYASLAYLRDLPVDVLKLDRSFLRTDKGGKRDELLVHRIIQLAGDLGLETVAEGVEDDETLQLLRRLGCNQAQGFYIARPVPAAQLTPLLSQDWRDAKAQASRI
jgi:diguanylate cyclase (GGDEF)-like protein